MYKCSKCGLAVIVTKDTNEIIRACKCEVDGKPAPIIGDMSSGMKGKAKFNK